MDRTPQDVDSQADARRTEEPTVEQQVSALSTLLHQVDEPSTTEPSTALVEFENHLAEVRLGLASSLFVALRCKHPPTAAHALRVAVGCSSFSFALNMTDDERDRLEVAALLHDVGKIGVPDRILLKPGPLSPDEMESMDRHRLAGLDILRACCSSQEILDIVGNSPAWFDGSRRNYALAGNDIPRGARALAVVDAFDSMTSDHVYRRAMSRERALSELFRCAGTQFDPELVRLFSELHEKDRLNEHVAARWLHHLNGNSDLSWKMQPVPASSGLLLPNTLFRERLLDNMHDAVMFVDRNLRIMFWNRGAERLTGIGATSVDSMTWIPSLVGMVDERGKPIEGEECPVQFAVQNGVQSLRRMLIKGRDRHPVAVEVHCVPVVDDEGMNYGAAVLFHDASPQASLEQRCQNLHERATKDQLTNVANRAEFDRTHKTFVAAHLERRLPCSLIMCDIDHFKQVNDTYGHPAGDEVLKSVAQFLKSSCRPGDLVARYGGEEFVILCADCTNATVAKRAERLRRAIGELPQSALNGKPVTVSFGVTEVQAGDTPETMLRRADRALLVAKQRGRNIVVQLGAGIGEVEDVPQRSFWFKKRGAGDVLLESWLVTAVPFKVAIEKLRGFVADQRAEILSINESKVILKVCGERGAFLRRTSDRPIPFQIELSFSEDRAEIPQEGSRPATFIAKTRVCVAIRPYWGRDRRFPGAVERARHVLASVKSYLMATEEDPPQGTSAARRASNLLAPWRKLRR